MKRKVFRILLILAGILLLGIGALLAYVTTALPDVGDAPELTIEPTPARIERGKYLANNVMVCIDCHSKRDWNIFTAPPIAGTEGMGGEVFDQQLGFPGRYVASNITPAGLSDWTDGEIFRAITSGVSKDGRALFPIMPHPNFGKLDQEDIYSVIAYIRTLPAIENTPEASVSDFPMNIIINTIPAEPQFSERPDIKDTINYGKYLVTAASCYDCHTQQEKGKFIGEPFAGGMEFHFPDGHVLRSANITPHLTGIGNWSEDVFLKKFRRYTDSTYVAEPVKSNKFQTVMPWTMYAQMTDEDLKAIYAYLQSVEPAENIVECFSMTKFKK